ncbi:hypothetical protein OTSGILL_2368 [Orientia tsutsugamushi str. Gilliam]|uniref:Uncharacterized protein n=1 Tax=Orientia tsutsugamushi str. Gilliam TaxID=1359184 RepID=A0A0F3M9N8_ORITS|nr:hypothetical protein OTSGILL_2368 [Orientia tsutsugamushi str. Gilliam]
MLLKLAGRYSNYHFGCKASVLNYIAQALANELRTTDQANSDNCRFDNVENLIRKNILLKLKQAQILVRKVS